MTLNFIIWIYHAKRNKQLAFVRTNLIVSFKQYKKKSQWIWISSVATFVANYVFVVNRQETGLKLKP